jgi:hypothetical protein
LFACGIVFTALSSTGACTVSGSTVLAYESHGFTGIVLWQWALILVAMYVITRIIYYLALSLRSTKRK